MLKLALIVLVAIAAHAGVDIQILKPGKLPTPKEGQKVTVHYTLTLQNGKKIDSSRDRGKPFEFIVGKGEVISGWDEGIQKVLLGSRVKFTVSPDKAYGDNPPGDDIPKGATLIFDIELLKIDDEGFTAPAEESLKEAKSQDPVQPTIAAPEGNGDQPQIDAGENANKVMEKTETELNEKMKALETEIDQAQERVNKETVPGGGGEIKA